MNKRSAAAPALTAAFLLVSAAWAQPASPPALAAVETAYADFNDAGGAISLLDSGFRDRFDGKAREAWIKARADARAHIDAGLAELADARLSASDARALQLIRATLADADTEGSMTPAGRCADAQAGKIEYDALREALYACFGQLANSLEFEGAKLTRIAAFDLLTRMEEPARRKALFHSFVPVWRAVNGESESDSPYRRLIVMAAARAREKGSAIDAAARTVGASTAQVETWLTQILDTWRQVTAGTRSEPWDYRFRGGDADRELGDAIAREALQPINERYYLDLGANLAKWDVFYDLDPRSGKAPLAYTGYVRRGRWLNGSWRPTVVQVSGNYARGGLGPLNELAHENGHVVHMMALKTRPAFMDLGDPLFYEAFADVPSWSTYEPAWQRKYLGRSASEAASLRALYSSVMLDVAWALFELRMLRDPTQDPNVLWTEITSRYLHVVPHPGLAWWAVRVQLVHLPGYMVNYGLGAVVTADLRQRIEERLGGFATGDVRWYPWLAQHLLASGQERETAELLRAFLGRPVSPDALLAQLGRMKNVAE
ncbi:MAG: M3 family metallopeptidase [Steroidobacteraceae bacterium]